MSFIEVIFLVSVILIWFMIAYQFIFSVYGYINYVKSLLEKKKIDNEEYTEFPSCTILIPAHNEEKVISYTIEAMLNLKYPKDKLKIMVINDGSKDRTKEIIEGYAANDSRVVLYDVPVGQGGKGKSRALNLAIKQAKSEVIAIYDADNTPDPMSLHYLVINLMSNKEYGAVIGKFRTVNKARNLLTRFINIETLSFQSMLQAGRWQMHNIATLPGTNFVMWKWLIDELDGWDEEALTEDSELSIRIYELGYKIKFCPYAVTWEQEPETWKVWIKQRVRWVRGNNYVIAKFFRKIPHFKNKRLGLDLFYTMALYYIFFFAIIISDILFVLSLLSIITIPLPGPYSVIWVMAIVLFMFEITLAISFDKEDTPRNIALILIMYFTYCQLWIFIMFKAFYIDNIKKEGNVWDKTVRFDVQPKKKPIANA
ncbi:MAG TPA: glycosyltransferase family 2 protein [Williamwhitmania sp.]|nr:glycosyltransferase family 2 protein [Williamwhitmania sp.]